MEKMYRLEEYKEACAKFNRFKSDSDYHLRRRDELIKQLAPALRRISDKHIEKIGEIEPRLRQICCFTEEDLRENKNGELDLVLSVYNHLFEVLTEFLDRYQEALC